MSEMVIEFGDDDQWKGLFVDLGREFEDLDLETPLTFSLDILATRHREFFNNEFDPSHGAWAPLSESTARRKGHDTILFDTGRLKESLATPGPQGSADSIREVFSDGKGSFSLVFGTKVEYAVFHQEGRGVTQRAHVGVNDDILNQIAEVIADASVDAMLE